MKTHLRSFGGLLLAGLVLTASAIAAEADLRLVTAAREQNMPAVRALLAEGVDVNAARADGATALLWAAHWDHLDAVDLLLRAGANVNAAEDQGSTPLALACENASAAMVTKLLASGANPNAPQANGVAPLMTAARTGNLKIVQALLGRGAAVNAVIPATGQTALMWATAERHLDITRELVAAGADVRVQSKIGFTPLLFAARNGDIEAARVLLAAGARVNDSGSDGTHALPLAIVSGHDAFALFLLEQGADPNGTMHGVSALHAAVGSVDLWLRDWLRERHASIDARASAGLDPTRRVAVVKTLIARGADPNARITTSTVMGLGVSGRNGAFDTFSVGTGDLKGATPLWIAAYVANSPGRGGAEPSGQRPASLETLRVLLEGGANPNLSSADLTTPLMVAAGLGRSSYQPAAPRGTRSTSAEAAVTMLVEAGAEVNAVNEAKFTALHGAAFRGLNEVIQYLVDHGANINAQDFKGRTPYRLTQGAQQMFRIQGWPETAEFLKKLGADTTLGVEGRVTEHDLDSRKGTEPGKP
jgi:ankyrin repeat protein